MTYRNMPLKTWICTDFTGYYPVGTSAVMLAETKSIAERMLRYELGKGGLDKDQEITITELDGRQAKILNDGDY